MSEKPIPFSTEMVRAILDGRKTQTRRVIKPQPISPYFAWGSEYPCWCDNNNGKELICPYGQPGDVLWVKEAWKCVKYNNMDGDLPFGVTFRADEKTIYTEFNDNERYEKFGKFTTKNGWQSPYFMPREAARLFLQVKDVQVERLQDITENDARAEGVDYCCPSRRHKDWNNKWISGYCHDCAHHNPMTSKRETCPWGHDDEETRFQWWCGCSTGSFKLRDDNIPEPYRFKFAFVWDELGKPPFWDQNPYVWVISFERIRP